MRFIHTSDWHLGRMFYGIHLTVDQSYILEQFIEIVKNKNPDAVIIAGDIYDRAVPPTEAVSLLNEVLPRLIVDHKVPVIMIAGNHDSAERLDFGSKILSSNRLYVTGSISAILQKIELEDKYGPVHFYAIPYAEPVLVQEQFKNRKVKDHDSSMKVLVKNINGKLPETRRSVLIAHAFVTGGEHSESERPLSVGGTGEVNIKHFSYFNYVALGHLHRPQSIKKNHIEYSGALMKYSFSEANHEKSISLVEINEKGECSMKRIALKPKRDVRVIEGYLEEILRVGENCCNKNDYLLVSLLDKEPILDIMGKLRSVYPNVLHIERPAFHVSRNDNDKPNDHTKISEKELFSSFFKQVTGENLSNEQEEEFSRIIGEFHRQEREVLK